MRNENGTKESSFGSNGFIKKSFKLFDIADQSCYFQKKLQHLSAAVNMGPAENAEYMTLISLQVLRSFFPAWGEIIQFKRIVSACHNSRMAEFDPVFVANV